MGAFIALIGVLILLGGFAVGLYGLAFWLKKGVWTGNTLALLFGPYTPQDWSGVAQIMVWLWAQPLWGVLVVTGLVLAIAGTAASAD
jgi:hypothetical protein